jgi:hypothetical protein
MISRFFIFSRSAAIRLDHQVFLVRSFSGVVKSPADLNSSEASHSHDVSDLAKLKESFEKNDIKLFNREFRLFALQMRKTHQQISVPTRLYLTSMISSFGSHQLKQQNFVIPSLLRSMAYCGYSMTSKLKDETALLSTLEQTYLSSSSFGFLDDILLFFTSISKLRFSWQSNSEQLHKQEIILLIDKIKNERISPRQLEELITSIVTLGIPWKELTIGSQEKILEKTIKLVNFFDPISLRTFLKSFSSFDGIHIKEMSPIVAKVFLSMSTDALELKGLEKKEEEWGRQV